MAVSDATVSLGTKSGPPATTTSDQGGNYSLVVANTSINTNTTVVITVAKEGYQSCTGTVSLTDGRVSGCNVLPVVATGELYPALADATLVRLGDGEVSGGAANSELQLALPFGLSKTVTLRWPANLALASYQTLTVNATKRGLQSSLCADKVTVLQGATLETAAVVREFSATAGNLADSDARGGLTPYALQLPATALSATGGDLYVKLEAGLCRDGTAADPADDYEFVGLFGKFS